MADEAEKMAGVEASIADALQPFAPNFTTKRPHVYPVVDAGPEEVFEPVRTLTQFLVDIEKLGGTIHARVKDQDQHLAEILRVIDERLARIENSIRCDLDERLGRIENSIGVR
jgi:hypothetical protein